MPLLLSVAGPSPLLGQAKWNCWTEAHSKCWDSSGKVIIICHRFTAKSCRALSKSFWALSLRLLFMEGHDRELDDTSFWTFVLCVSEVRETTYVGVLHSVHIMPNSRFFKYMNRCRTFHLSKLFWLLKTDCMRINNINICLCLTPLSVWILMQVIH